MAQRKREKIKPSMRWETTFNEAIALVEADGFHLMSEKNLPLKEKESGLSQKKVYWHDMGVLIYMDAYRSSVRENDSLNGGNIYTNLLPGSKDTRQHLLSGSGSHFGRGDGTMVSCHSYDLKSNYRDLIDALEKNI